jgi:pimeloyl-ACP methyl ester carboxylesterase
VLAHSAGANIAVQYAVSHGRRVRRLALITLSGRAVGLQPDTEMRRRVVALRRDEPWFAEAAAAFERVAAGSEAEDDWSAIAPFFYGRWDTGAQAHAAADEAETNEEAAQVFISAGAFDPMATRAGLARFGSPVLMLTGGIDPQGPPFVAAEFAALFPSAELVVQPGAGHYPWLDDAASFVAAVTAFLDGSPFPGTGSRGGT